MGKLFTILKLDWEKICIEGRITENDLPPIPGEFPGGKVRLVTTDGITRAECDIGIDGSFEVHAAPNLYRVEADSETRIQTIEKDCTNKGASSTVLNYTDIVITGNIAMRDGGVPSTFPETIMSFKEQRGGAKTIVMPKGTGSFKTVLPSGSYSVHMSLRDSSVTIITAEEKVRQSCKKIINYACRFDLK